MFNIKERKGQSIIEAMLAISALVIGLLGVVSLTTRALSEERGIADSFRASYLAAEGIEIARNIIDGNYISKQAWNCTSRSGASCAFVGRSAALDYTSTDFNGTCSSGGDRLYLDGSGRYTLGSAGTSPTPFTRCVTIAVVSPREMAVYSVVSWSSRGNAMSIHVEDHFFNWRPQ